MQTTPEKKFFYYNNQKYTLVKGKRWYIEYYQQVSPEVKTRKREYGRLTTIKDIKAREAAALRLIEKLASSTDENVRKHRQKQLGDPTQTNLSLLERTLEDNKHLFRIKSYSSYKSHLKYWRLWIDKHQAGTPDELVSPAQARAFLAWLAGRKAKATVRAYYRTLHGLCGRANLGNNPFEGIKTAAPDSKSLKPFTDAQAKAIYRKASPTLRMCILLLSSCFIRPGEQRLLDVSDIDLERRLIEMRGEISKNKKTQNVVIPDSIAEQLRAFIGDRLGGLLLVNPKTGKLLPKYWLYRSHEKILKELKINGRYSLYSWKHTGVIKAVQAGINLKDLQNQLRHYSLDMVNEYLKDLGAVDSKDLREKFPAIL
jgi:integrase